MQEWENQPVDYYKILQSDPGAETDVIEGAYKKLCKYHPDKPGGNEEKFKKINKAWEILRDPGKRQAYDTWYQHHYAKGHTTAAPPLQPPRLVAEPDVLSFDNLYPGRTETRSFVLKNEGGDIQKYCKIDPPDPQGPLRTIQPSSNQFPLTVTVGAVGAGWGRSVTEDIVIRFDGMETRLRVEISTRPLTAWTALSEAGGFIARVLRKVPGALIWRRKARAVPVRRTSVSGKKTVGWILVILLLFWGGSELMKIARQQFVFTRDLAQGAEGNEVTELQKRLASAGVYSAPITGYFGDATEDAVKAYQKAHSIEPTGIVGPQTRTWLNGSEPDSNTAAERSASDTRPVSQAGAAATILHQPPLSDSPAAVVVTLVDESGKPALDAVYKSSPDRSGGYMPHIAVIDSASGSVVWQKECLSQGSCSFGHPRTGIFETDPLPVGKYLLKVTIPAGVFETAAITLAEKEFEVKGDQKILSLGSLTLIGIR